ncbi:MAG: aminoacyl-tRNA hydrolase [Pseudomonadota bacterium]|jgi:PTH1 family peptidyl-tRNA hydrolase|nr:aminoacyl-tRNA hydrolase [Pseudomonadota bacterium]MEC8956057.1 aminoacyl-tRNA hydrolase [Pseudomonadota bacterium]
MNKNLSVIAGIGNPGERYERTLHNVGFWFVDEIAATNNLQFSYHKKFDAEVCQVNISKNDIWLIKPQNYMNMSGGPIKAFLNYYQIPTSGMLVVHDEIDLPSNKVKLKVDGGHGGHNGLRDIIQHCGNGFMRIRLGVGHPGDKHEVINYVLRNASSELKKVITKNIQDSIAILPTIIEDNIEKAMKILHTSRDGKE